MKNAPAAFSIILVVGCLAFGCNSKEQTESKAETPAQFKSSGIQTAVAATSAAPTPAPNAAAAPQSVLPVAIAGTDARLVRFELASGIVDREPAGITTSFSRTNTARVFAFIEVANKHGQPFEVEVRFERVGAAAKSHGFKLTIPDAERWRTQALMATRTAGTYRAVVSGPDGTQLVAREFTVAE